MGKHEKNKSRCPFGGRIISFIFCMSIVLNAVYYGPVAKAEEPDIETIPEPILVEEFETVSTPQPVIDIVEPEPEPIEETVEEAPIVIHNYNGKGLTKRGGVYWNPNTGLKETWYSQKVLPGGGLDIPGRHVNNEGFVCDGDGYICVSSSTYPKGTIIETSRGMGKVYDSGCAPGILDIYVDW